MYQNLASAETSAFSLSCDGGLLGSGSHGFLCLLFFADIINGVQEKCVLPPMDGYPHCEGKVKVKYKLCLFVPAPSAFIPLPKTPGGI